jgi:hypothetical protein
MNFLNKLLPRKAVGALYADHLPKEILYRNRSGDEISVPTESATVDELAFALQLASEAQLIGSRRRAAIEDLYQNARKSGALGADRMTDIAWKE